MVRRRAEGEGETKGIRKTKERGRYRQREKKAPAGRLMRNSIPGPWDHVLGLRQMLNH